MHLVSMIYSCASGYFSLICSAAASELAKELENLTGEMPGKETLERARGLFAKALETPGGLKIMTIHSFCTTVLERFPLEASVPPHFKVIEELEAGQLLSHSLDQVLESPNAICLP